MKLVFTFVLKVLAFHLILIPKTDAEVETSKFLVFSVPDTVSSVNNSEDSNENNFCSRLESGKLIK